MGMISPGPVVITATFVGYLVAARLGGSLLDGLWGSVASTVGIFLPSFLLILIVAPILVRYRQNVNVQGFIKGAYAAAIGTILGACVLLGRIAIGDLAHGPGGPGELDRAVPVEGQQSRVGGGHGDHRTDRVSALAARVGVREVEHGAVNRP
jgi:chromate transporter